MFRRNRHKLAGHLLCYCNICIWFQNILQQQVICCFDRMHFMIWVSTTYVCYRLLWGIVWLTILAWIWEPQLLQHQLKRSSKCTAKPALHSLSLISATRQHNDESLSVFFNFCWDSGFNLTLGRHSNVSNVLRCLIKVAHNYNGFFCVTKLKGVGEESGSIFVISNIDKHFRPLDL